MLTKEFNVLPLPRKSALVFGEGKLIAIYEDNKFQKVFYYKFDAIKIDVVYDKVNNRLLDIIAWENTIDRVNFLKMPVTDNYSAQLAS